MNNAWDFKSVVPENSVHVIADEFHDASGCFTVEWTADIELRSWGIKSIEPLVHMVSGMLSRLDEDAVPEDFISDGFEIEEHFILAPKSITIDIPNKTILVE
jgi:hypothetical protein